MSNQNNELTRVLEKLDEWRHLPKYRLESHIDVLIALCLPHIIRSMFAVGDKLSIIPEFPLHKKIVLDKQSEKNNHRSINVDFAAFSEQRNCFYLIELKTDNNSLKGKRNQDRVCKLETAKMEGAAKIFCGVINCAQNSSVQTQFKYRHLISKLQKIGCIEGFEDEDRNNFGNLSVNWNKAKIKCGLIFPGIWPDSDPKPTVSNSNLVDWVNEQKWLISFQFHQVAEELERVGKQQLACYLKEWSKLEAGTEEPRKYTERLLFE